MTYEELKTHLGIFICVWRWSSFQKEIHFVFKLPGIDSSHASLFFHSSCNNIFINTMHGNNNPKGSNIWVIFDNISLFNYSVFSCIGNTMKLKLSFFGIHLIPRNLTSSFDSMSLLHWSPGSSSKISGLLEFYFLRLNPHFSIIIFSSLISFIVSSFEAMPVKRSSI